MPYSGILAVTLSNRFLHTFPRKYIVLKLRAILYGGSVFIYGITIEDFISFKNQILVGELFWNRNIE
jgi:hypothetical protein